MKQAGFESGLGMVRKPEPGKQALQLSQLHSRLGEETDAYTLPLFHERRESVLPYTRLFKALNDFVFITDRNAGCFERLNKLRGFDVRVADHGVFREFLVAMPT